MKKILASIAALAVASTMAVSAFAATTLTGADEYCGDWSATNFVDAEGNLVAYIDNANFADYLDTGCTVTVDFDFKTLAGNYYDYYLFGVCDQNWAKLYATDNSYIAGVPGELDARETAGGAAKFYDDGVTPVCSFFNQGDGFMVFSQDANGEWTTESFKFTLTADALQYLVDNATVNEDGSVYGGVVFQTYGIDVKSITIDAAEDLTGNGFNADPNAGAGDSNDDAGSDDNAATGASAGLALAAIALAGAAVVATKKNK